MLVEEDRETWKPDRIGADEDQIDANQKKNRIINMDSEVRSCLMCLEVQWYGKQEINHTRAVLRDLAATWNFLAGSCCFHPLS